MSKNIEKQYLKLLKDILDNGVEKDTRNGKTLSVFGRQIRHDMSKGFPLLTTKKMYWKGIVTELLWFLRGDTDIRFLWENNCFIWDGDWYKKYKTTCSEPYTLEEVKQMVKDGNHKFHDSMFELGPVYGKQWRSWNTLKWEATNKIDPLHPDRPMLKWNLEGIDQITNLIHDLKTNPDSRRLMVNAWNVGELDQMTLPPCHYGFQVYTRELTMKERMELYYETCNQLKTPSIKGSTNKETMESYFQEYNIPTRAISLMWNQRSVDTFLGLPFNIASYGLLLEIIAKAVNMVPDELVGNLGDVHLYSNHIEQAKEQLTREPYSLPKFNINTEWWPTESGECGVGLIDAQAVFAGFMNDHFCKCLLEEDIQLANYQSHPTIVAPLSN